MKNIYKMVSALAILVVLVSAVLSSCAPAPSREVRFYGWGGSAAINSWLDTVVKQSLKEERNLDFVRVAAEAPAILAKLREEKAAGKTSGSMDLIWINGENFKTAKKEGLLQGPMVQKLPNYLKYVDPALASYDFGTPTEGLESPWGKAQFVFEYDSARITSVPRNVAELKAWILKNPGRFTYPELPDFTGSAFIRQLFLQLAGGPQEFLGDFEGAKYQPAADRLFAWLEEVRPALWNQGKTYPRTSADLDLLFERGEVDWSVTYTPSRAQGKIQEGRYPATVRTLVLEEGSLSNIHFLAVPFNAPNPENALALADHLLSPALQLSKNIPAHWGDFPVVDISKLEEKDRAAFQALDLGAATLPADVLSASAFPEISPEYVERLEADWQKHLTGE